MGDITTDTSVQQQTNAPQITTATGIQQSSSSTVSGTQVSPDAMVTGNNNKITISSIIEDNTGGISSTRVLMLAWGMGVLAIWGFATVMAVMHGVYTGIPIPESVVTILLGVVGGKICQRPFEK